MGKIEFPVERARQIVAGKDEQYRRIEHKWINEKKGNDTFFVVVEDVKTGRFYRTEYDYGRSWITGKVYYAYDYGQPVFTEVKPKIVQKTVWEDVQDTHADQQSTQKPEENNSKDRQKPKWDLKY